MVDTNGRAVVTGGAPPDFGVSEKKTKRKIDSNAFFISNKIEFLQQ